MDQQVFSRREVERSFRKFNDIVSDLTAAQSQTWGHQFAHLIAHCERDPVMQVITEPLRTNRNVDASKWYSEAMNSVGSGVGSGFYELPTDDDERTALLYQFFLLLVDGKIQFNDFCSGMYILNIQEESYAVFNQELVHKFTREVSYRLDEIMEDAGERQHISSEAMMVFHHHDHSMTVHGNIQGSNLATGGSSISGSAATFTNNEELAYALKGLEPLIHDIAEGQRGTVEQALKLLIQATQDSSITKERVAEATKAIAANSPTMSQRLKDIAGKVGIELITSSVIKGIELALATLT
jgi:hypothetical protein